MFQGNWLMDVPLMSSFVLKESYPEFRKIPSASKLKAEKLKADITF